MDDQPQTQGVAPLATTPRGWPYAVASDMVTAWPEVSHTVANMGDALRGDTDAARARADACLPRDGSQAMSGGLHASGGMWLSDATIPLGYQGVHTRWMIYGPDGQVRRLSDGDFRLLVASIAGASTARLKDDITEPATSPDLTRVRPQTYRWNDDSGRAPIAPGQRYGLIAEQVAAVDERLVIVGQDGQVSGLDDHALIAALIQTVNDLSARITALETQP